MLPARKDTDTVPLTTKRSLATEKDGAADTTAVALTATIMIRLWVHDS